MSSQRCGATLDAPGRGRPDYLDDGASDLERAWSLSNTSSHLPGLPSSSHPRALSQVNFSFFRLIPEKTLGHLHTHRLPRTTPLTSVDVSLDRSQYLETTTRIQKLLEKKKKKKQTLKNKVIRLYRRIRNRLKTL